MANKVIGTGEIEIIFNYEKNFKSLLGNIKKEWASLNIDKTFAKIDESLKRLNTTIAQNTTNTNNNNKPRKEEKDLNEKLINQNMQLDKALKTANTAQKAYIQSLKEQLAQGKLLQQYQKERISLLGAEREITGKSIALIGTLGYQLGNVGNQMYDMVKNAVLFQAQIEKNIAVTGAIAGASKTEVAELKDAMIQIGTDVPIKFTKISESMYSMASAGLYANEILLAMPKAVKLSVGVGEDLNRVTELLISSVKAFDLDFKDSSKLLDLFGNSVARSMATVEKLQVSFARVAPVAQQVGVSVEETTAILSKLYDLGLRGSNAGTVLLNVMTKLSAFTDQSESALKKAGLTVGDVSLEYNTLAESLAKVTLKMREGKLGAEQLQQIFGMRGKIITDFMGQLKGTNVQELTQSYDELVSSISDASGAVEKFFSAQEETTQMAIDKFGNSLDSMKILVGDLNKDALVPLLDSMTEIVNKMVELGRTNPNFADFISGTSKTMAVTGKLMSLFDKFSMSIVALVALMPAITAGLTAIGTSSLGTTVSLGLFGASVSPILIGLGLVAGVVAGVVLAIKALNNELKENRLEDINEKYKAIMDADAGYVKYNKDNIKALEVSKQERLAQAKDESEKLAIEVQFREAVIKDHAEYLEHYAERVKDFNEKEAEYIKYKTLVAKDEEYIKASKLNLEKLEQQKNRRLATAKDESQRQMIEYQYRKDVIADYASYVTNKEKYIERQMIEMSMEIQSSFQNVVDIFGSATKEMAIHLLKQLEVYARFGKGIAEEDRKQIASASALGSARSELLTNGGNYQKAIAIADATYESTMSALTFGYKDNPAIDAIKAMIANFGVTGDDKKKKEKKTPTSKDANEGSIAKKYFDAYFDKLLASTKEEYLKSLDTISKDKNLTIDEIKSKTAEAEALKNKKIKDIMENSLRDMPNIKDVITKSVTKADLKGLNKKEFEQSLNDLLIGKFEDVFKAEPLDITKISQMVNDRKSEIELQFSNFNKSLSSLFEFSETFIKGDSKTRELVSGSLSESIGQTIGLGRFQSEMAKSPDKYGMLDESKKLEIKQSIMAESAKEFMKSLEDIGYSETMKKYNIEILKYSNTINTKLSSDMKDIKNVIDPLIKDLTKNMTAQEILEISPKIDALYTTIGEGSKNVSAGALEAIKKLNDINTSIGVSFDKEYEDSVLALKNYLESFNSAIKDIPNMMETYVDSESSQLKSMIKEQMKNTIKSLSNVTEEELNSLLSKLDIGKEAFSEAFAPIKDKMIGGLKGNKEFKVLESSMISARAKASGKTEADIKKDQFEMDTIYISILKEMVKSTDTVSQKLKKLVDGMSSLSSGLSSIANVIGGNFGAKLGNIASIFSEIGNMNTSMAGIASAGGIGTLAGFGSMLGAVGSIASIAKTLDSLLGINLLKDRTSEVESMKSKQKEEWDTQNSLLSEINDTLKGNLTSLVSYSEETANNTTPTKSNLALESNQFKNIYSALSSQIEDFKDIVYVTESKKSKGMFKGDENVKSNTTVELQDIFSNLGFKGNIQDANTEMLQKFNDALKNISMERLRNINYEGGTYVYNKDTILDTNIDEVSESIQRYIDLLKNAEIQAREFRRTSTLSDFTGINVENEEKLFQGLIETYESMGVEITDAIETQLREVAKEKSITETISSSVRDGVVNGWSQGMSTIKSLKDSLGIVFSGIYENVSKALYDNSFDAFNNSLSTFYKSFSIQLEQIKEAGGDSKLFAKNYDYSALLKAIKDVQDVENSMSEITEAIRQQARAQGVDEELIDYMLNDTYRIELRGNIKEAISSGIMDGFNNKDIDVNSIKNSIFSTIVETGMAGIIESINSSPEVSKAIADMMNAISAGDFTSIEALGESLAEIVGMNVDEQSEKIQLLMDLIDGISGKNTQPLVFFDEMNIKNMEDAMLKFDKFSLETKALEGADPNVRRLEITLTSDNPNLSDEALDKIGKSIAGDINGSAKISINRII
jgi:TP901 family phage tail tape measure protein